MTDNKDYNYSYTDGDNLVLMDPETYEQRLFRRQSWATRRRSCRTT